jgi:hypothetical protein
MDVRGSHLLAVAGILLASLAVRGTEVYASQYQTLPVLDWLEARPPLAESASVPSAADLARGIVQTSPLLVISDDVRPLLGVFGPPAVVQRTMGGVRDAARIQLGAPGLARQASDQPVRLHLDVLVFHRALRAEAWSDLMASEMDVRDPERGNYQVRVAGPEEREGVWLSAPRERDAIATVAGWRGSVGFVLQAECLPRPGEPRGVMDLTARAEVIARQAAADWLAWLERQPGVA